MFSFNHSLLPPKFNDYFSLNKQVHSYATRYANDFYGKPELSYDTYFHYIGWLCHYIR